MISKYLVSGGQLTSLDLVSPKSGRVYLIFTIQIVSMFSGHCSWRYHCYHVYVKCCKRKWATWNWFFFKNSLCIYLKKVVASNVGGAELRVTLGDHQSAVSFICFDFALLLRSWCRA